MTTGMRSIKKLLYWMLVADLLLAAVAMRMGMEWLISSQVAFFSSLLATLASFYAYGRMIDKKIEAGDIPAEERDTLDQIEDRFELYDDEAHSSESVAELKAVIKEERRKIGGIKNSMQTLAKTIGAAISPLRVGAYLVLILGFLYLNRHDILEIWGYVSGLAVVPVVAFLSGWLSRGETPHASHAAKE